MERTRGSCDRSTYRLQMSKPKVQPPEQTLETLLDKVAVVREELVAIERALERLGDDITKSQKRNSSRKKTTR
jgi:hypothetical protein